MQNLQLLKRKIKTIEKSNLYHNLIASWSHAFSIAFFLLSKFFRVTLAFLEQLPILNRFL